MRFVYNVMALALIVRVASNARKRMYDQVTAQRRRRSALSKVLLQDRDAASWLHSSAELVMPVIQYGSVDGVQSVAHVDLTSAETLIGIPRPILTPASELLALSRFCRLAACKALASNQTRHASV